MSLMTLLVGCAATSAPATKTKVVYESPPAALYPECAEPVLNFTTNEALAESFYAVRSALTECRAGVEDLRQWGDDNAGGQQ